MNRLIELLELLACPREKLPLRLEGDSLICEQGHRYPVIDGVPVFLIGEIEQTHIEGTRSLKIAESGDASSLPNFEVREGMIDPFVCNAIGATNGSLYQHLVGTLDEYPIPQLRLPPGDNRLFLEIGCNWGRWCIAAARLGYRVIGIDPSLKAIRAAKRVASQLKVEALYIVGDARVLPFQEGALDQVFSYSVLQHLSKPHVGECLAEIRRTMKVGGNALIQMPNTFGIRCLYHQIRRGFREGSYFDVRYWRPSELQKTFEQEIGPSSLDVDGYFSLNIQPSDIRLLPRRYRAIVHTSESLRRASRHVPVLKKIADSLYVSSTKSS